MKRDFGPATQLSIVAHEILLDMLQRYGNHVSPQHALALEQLIDGFTKQGLGISSGRRAYALPCGSGKTLSVVAWVAAQHKLSLNLSIAVSAHQINSLLDIKDALVAEGVPESLIGIRHTKGLSARWPDTGDDDRLIMLGSHSRIKRSDEMPSFCRYKGLPRDLLIWDESLISSDTTTIIAHEAISALAYFGTDPMRPLARAIQERLREKVEDECAKQQAGGEPSDFVLITDDELKRATAELNDGVHGGFAWANLRKARETLRQLARSMTVLNVGSGWSGLVLMGYRIVLDPALENIAVLDASYVVSELCKADPTIRDATTAAMLEYKDYSSVLVKQTPASSGRWQFERKAESALALEAAVASIRSVPAQENVLVVTYLPSDGIDLIKELMRKLKENGIEVDRGRQDRIRFTTWGKHTTDNSFSDSRHVIALGVLRQSSAAVAASMAGQKDDATYRMKPQRLADVELSLLASNIMQAMSRGNCRRVDAGGRALPMTLHLITKEVGLRPLLCKAMPGLQWETVSVKPPTRTEDASKRIVDYLLALPQDTLTVSTRRLYVDCGISAGKDLKAAALAGALIKLALLSIRNPAHRWAAVGRSLARKTVK